MRTAIPRLLYGACAGAILLAAGCGAGNGAFKDGDAVLRRTSYRLKGFDPVQASDVYSAKAVGLVYEGLLRYSYRARPYELEPCLAVSLPEASEDGLTYTFRVRPDAHFHADPCFGRDASGMPLGRRVLASDFVYSIKRLADLRNASPGYWAFSDRIQGLDAFRDASRVGEVTDYSLPVAGLTALDERRVRIRLKRPYPQLLWVLAMSYAAVVPREAVEYYGEGFVNHPVGTGPYRLEGWQRNHRVEFRAVPQWRGWPQQDALGGRPIERIVMHVIDDPSTRWLCFLAGQLDLYDNISRDNWDAVMNERGDLDETLRKRGIRMSSIPSLETAYIAFNMDDPVLGPNRALRRALTCAFNTGEWLALYNHRIVRAKGPIPPGVAGFRNDSSPYPFDLERARTLLSQAGYTDGIDPDTGRRLTLTLDLGRTDLSTRESTELFVAFMDRLGLVIQPSYNNWPAFLKKIGRRQAQMFRIGWVADYPDAENFLQLFYSGNASPGPNRANYSNPDLDALYERVRTMPASRERTALYGQMEDIVVEDCPWIFLHHRVDYVLRHDRLAEYLPHDFPYGMEQHYRLRSTAGGQ